MTQLTDNIFAVEVPEDACGLEVYNNNLYGLTHPAMSAKKELAYLSLGTWKFLFTTKGMTEDQAARVVRELPVGKRYENYAGDYPIWYHTARESLRSLLRSKGINDKKNYAILKKQP